MGFLKQIFTWWEGATIGTALHVRRAGRKVGEDGMGNIYYQAKKGGRRFVIYKGANDAGQLPPEWHSWLHHQIEGLPDEALPPAPKFLKEPTGNRTGTAQAYKPAGALDRGGVRAAASGDYEAWTPDGP
jgi:NADH:ubiquinone oxidoreductase subunit